LENQRTSQRRKGIGGEMTDQKEIMVKVIDWENGKVKLANEFFQPIFQRPKDEIIDNIIPNRLIYFRGIKTGTMLEPSFENVLEK